jgi:hypothetical protein
VLCSCVMNVHLWPFWNSVNWVYFWLYSSYWVIFVFFIFEFIGLSSSQFHLILLIFNFFFFINLMLTRFQDSVCVILNAQNRHFGLFGFELFSSRILGAVSKYWPFLNFGFLHFRPVIFLLIVIQHLFLLWYSLSVVKW